MVEFDCKITKKKRAVQEYGKNICIYAKKVVTLQTF